jgi:hypothetical protein
MFDLTAAEFDRTFAAILAQLNPQEIADALGANAVLLCWERPNARCHRRMVAEWLERALGVEIPEIGFSAVRVFPTSIFANPPHYPPAPRSLHLAHARRSAGQSFQYHWY